MKTFRTYIKTHPILSYFVLTFVLTWGCMILAAGSGGFPMSLEQLETTGPLVYVAMLIGPSVAGLLLIGIVDGKIGFRELLSRLLKWRVEIRWYATAILTAPLVAMVILLGLSLFSAEFMPPIFNADNKITLILSWFTGGLMIGLFEELGWTGFVIPKMRLRYSVLTTGIIVGLLWGAWHFLPFWEDDSFAKALPFALLLARLFSWLPPYRILMVWVYDQTESLLVTILMHASLVATLQIVVPNELLGTQLLIWLIVWAIVLWVLAGGMFVQERVSHHEESLPVAN